MRYGLLFLLNFLATSEFWALYSAPGDEALGVVGAQRLLLGEWPYRDWDTDITPGIYFVGAAWFGVMGVSSLAVRILFGLISATTSLAVQACAERVLRGRIRFLPWLLWTTCGVMEFPILNHHWLAGCFTLWGWFFALRWCGPNLRSDRLGLGACLGLAGWSIQSEGLSLVLTVALAWLACRPKGLGQVVAAAMAAVVLLWLPSLADARLIFEQNVVGIVHHVAYNRNPYSWANVQEFLGHYAGLSLKEHGPAQFFAVLSICFINLLRYLSLPVVALAALAGAFRRGGPPEKVVACAFLATLLANHGRMTFLYVSFQTGGWALAFTMVLSWIPRGAYLAALLAGLEVAGWTVRGWQRRQVNVYPIFTRGGVFYTADAAAAAGANQLGQWIQKYMPPGTPVLCFPYLADLYSNFGLRVPVRQILLPPGGVDPSVYPDVNRRLLERRVPYLIYVHVNVAEVSGNYDIAPELLEQQWREARRIVTRGYRLVEGNEAMGLYALEN